MLTLDEAIRQLRRDPAHADLVRDAYLGRDVRDSLERFRHSGEFHETLRLLGGVQGATIVDLGSGTGIAAAAFAAAGAALVYAIEPDPSEEVGRGAIARLQPPHAVHVLDALGEDLPLEEGSVDVVYARQVLHHALDLS